MIYLLLVVDLRLEVHRKLKLISTMSIAHFTDAIITLRSPFFITLWIIFLGRTQRVKGIRRQQERKNT